MGSGVITSRTLAHMMRATSSASDVSIRSVTRVPAGCPLKRLSASEEAVKRAAYFFSQRGVGVIPEPGRGLGPGRDQNGLRLADQAAVEALDLAEPADQVHAGAPGAGLELRGPVPRFLAGRADQDELVAQHATAPGALPPLRVRLPHAAAVTRQSPRPPSPVRR